MTIDKLKEKLKQYGWHESPNIQGGWYRGMASLSFNTDKRGVPILELADNDWGYIEMILKVQSTSKGLQITWKSTEMWWIIY